MGREDRCRRCTQLCFRRHIVAQQARGRARAMSVARLYRTGSPYNAAELAELDVEQSADTMYLAHLNHAPAKLVRGGHTDWTFSTVSFTPTLGSPTAVTATPT